MDTPLALKDQFVPGKVWELDAEPLFDGLHVLADLPGVRRAGLSGDHLRVIADAACRKKGDSTRRKQCINL